MEVSTTNNSYREWRGVVDRRLHQVYCITIENAGSDEDLVNHWQSKETPADFVEWYGNKYDLDQSPTPVSLKQLGMQR
jgi:hypothetical protein